MGWSQTGDLSKSDSHRLICLNVNNRGVTIFERIRRIRWCGFVEGSVSLGLCLAVAKAHAFSA